ncbi:hypothetical protein HPB48_007041 [Haemaphysalis longicornis]|uniref:Uncharacterized protein n=1 Tax=Haemaphysalis longicornis TaxID=44386 RepID=A0A9J6FF41_HAELO|nr:hypothetical protein HPB48_007041 [Haemaphysalis longicornis]
MTEGVHLKRCLLLKTVYESGLVTKRDMYLLEYLAETPLYKFNNVTIDWAKFDRVPEIPPPPDAIEGEADGREEEDEDDI